MRFCAYSTGRAAPITPPTLREMVRQPKAALEILGSLPGSFLDFRVTQVGVAARSQVEGCTDMYRLVRNHEVD
jgi:hypothetical protein